MKNNVSYRIKDTRAFSDGGYNLQKSVTKMQVNELRKGTMSLCIDHVPGPVVECCIFQSAYSIALFIRFIQDTLQMSLCDFATPVSTQTHCQIDSDHCSACY